MRDIRELLELVVNRDASDLHLKVGSPPILRIHGKLVPLDEDRLGDKDTCRYMEAILDEQQRERFFERMEYDLAYSIPGLGRFRTNLFFQRGCISIVMRRIKTEIPSFEELNLPPIIRSIAEFRRGLVLVTGTTGSGKSTTLAAIIEHINRTRSEHIVTIEDPIEYLHEDKLSIINQRELNIDTQSFAEALKHVLRQDPDVILIGEMRDIDTFMASMSASETGHLVFSTLHTTNAMQTIDRIVDLFPSTQQAQVRSQLALNLKAVVCQRLLPRKDGKGRVPACEVMLINPAIRKLIKDNLIVKIPNAIQQGREEGMQTFNDSLKYLVDKGLISQEEALAVSDNPEELAMNLQGIYLSTSTGGGILSGRGG